MKRLSARTHELLRRLHRDEGGNIIVLSVAAGLLLVAMVWIIIGAGARTVQKEAIQGSADAAAFSASVIKAKGLNIIAFCNLIMALLLALVLLLRAIKYVLIGFATAVSICAVIPVIVNPLEPICDGLVVETDNIAYNQFPQLEAKAEKIIKAAMKGLSVTERAVAKVTPVLAFAQAYIIGTDPAYKANFGKGSLVTVAWPLPIEGLPVKDGTCKDLANQAAADLGDLAKTALEKLTLLIGIHSDTIAGWLGDAVKALVSPLAGAMCGGTANVTETTKQTITDCGQCQSASGLQYSTWVGNSGVTEGNVIGGKFKTPDDKGKTCTMKSMPSWDCTTKSAKEVMCSDTDDKVWNWMQFQSCTVEKQTTEQVKSETDWPPPLVFADDWKQKVDTRAYTVLTDSSVDVRRQSVGIASKNKGSSPALPQMLGMAESEFCAWNDHEDLWHMDWRARLVPFTFGDTEDGDTSSASEVPSGSASMVSKLLGDFLSKSGTASLKDQFLLH